jgi:putative intracellular protease/amidase
VALLLWRNFGQGSLNWLQFFTAGAYVTSVAGGTATLVAAGYFFYRSARDRSVAAAVAPWAAVAAVD